jgi:hypothetical protein
MVVKMTVRPIAKRIGSLHEWPSNRASSYDDGLPIILGGK